MSKILSALISHAALLVAFTLFSQRWGLALGLLTLGAVTLLRGISIKDPYSLPAFIPQAYAAIREVLVFVWELPAALFYRLVVVADTEANLWRAAA